MSGQKDLLTTVPLFNCDGEYFRWSHKSIQEYFAAQFICQDSKGKEIVILRRMWRTPQNQRYLNVLDLCYDMDYKTFRRAVVLPLVCDFVNFYESSYGGINREVIPERTIHVRKLLTFYVMFVFCPKSLDDLFDDESEVDFDEGLERMLADHGISSDGFEAMIVGGRLSRARFERPERNILPLLLSKNLDIFRERKIKPKQSVLNRLKETWSTDIAVLVNDDPDSVLNKPEYFKAVNEVLADDEITTSNIDYNKAARMKTEIESEIEKEKTDGFFLDQL